jgi:pyruvate/2-oxoglutarate dehydrogenase complex dihydrolipoamide acyltransferase (E2) component
MKMKHKTVEIKMPWLTPPDEPETTVVEWLVSPGAAIEIDQDILKLRVDGVEFMLPAPIDGILTAVLVGPDEAVVTDQALAIVALVD